MKTFIFIYVLKDPRTGAPRYVGKSNDPHERLERHLQDSKRGRKDYKSCWIRSLLTLGDSPQLEILDTVDEIHWRQWEVAWIEFFISEGFKLVNGTPGGDGMSAGKFSPNWGRKWTPEMRVKIVDSLTGRKQSQETISKRIAKTTGKKRSAEARENISQSLKGKPLSPTHREAIRAALAGRRVSPDVAEKRKEAIRIRKAAWSLLSPEEQRLNKQARKELRAKKRDEYARANGIK